MTAPQKRVSLKDIAKAAEVSVSTVSQCLLHKSGPNAQTASRIRALAAEMGYRPNPVLSSLARSKFKDTHIAETTPIAVILHCTDPHYYPPVLAQDNRAVVIETYARQLGYNVHFYRHDCIPKPKNLIRELYHKGIIGVIVVLQSTRDLSLILDNDWSQFQMVVASNDYRLSRFHLACGNIFESIRLTWTNLLALGYKRIGWAVLKHPDDDYDDFIRYACINECQSQTALEYQIPPYSGTSFHDSEPFIKWFLKYRPEVVVGFQIGQYYWLKSAGLRIPQDVSFCHLHIDSKDSSQLDIGGIISMEYDVCQAAVTLLDQLIKHHSLGLFSQSCRIVINPSWKSAASCPILEK